MMSRSARPVLPTGYTLRVDGRLDQRWSPWFDNLTLTHDCDGTTSLSGPVCDQAQLHGLLTKIRDLGLTLISLDVIDPKGHVDEPASVDDQKVAGQDGAHQDGAIHPASETADATRRGAG